MASSRWPALHLIERVGLAGCWSAGVGQGHLGSVAGSGRLGQGDLGWVNREREHEAKGEARGEAKGFMKALIFAYEDRFGEIPPDL